MGGNELQAFLNCVCIFNKNKILSLGCFLFIQSSLHLNISNSLKFLKHLKWFPIYRYIFCAYSVVKITQNALCKTGSVVLMLLQNSRDTELS